MVKMVKIVSELAVVTFNHDFQANEEESQNSWNMGFLQNTSI
jgi:hypothetical protein